MNCSVEESSSYASLDNQNMKSKMYVPGVGKHHLVLYLKKKFSSILKFTSREEELCKVIDTCIHVSNLKKFN